MMFQGSKHVPPDTHFKFLESAGASDINGTTDFDRTNYFETLPSNQLELALWLESDRMGYLLDKLDAPQLANQQDVVRNERRQSIENAPYQIVEEEMWHMLFPKGHPYYAWVIGSHEDVQAAKLEDVKSFFRSYYAPNNASLVIAGDIDLGRTQALVEKWFGEIPAGPPVPPITAPPATLSGVTRKTVTDKVRLPRLYLGWLTPRTYAPGDAALDLASSVLADGKNSRLYKRLVYDTQMAQDVSAFQQSGTLGSSFLIIATARPGTSIADIQRVIDEELARLRAEPPDAREVQRAVNQIEAGFYRRMERVGGYGGKADQLNAYYTVVGTPDYFAQDLARYTALSPADVRAAIADWLPAGRRIELVVEPEGTR
jgi:zinc protease